MAIKLRYPTRWLTYQQRIEADLDESFADPDVAKLFDQDYTDSLIAPIKQQEEWILKLFALQFAIMCFLVIGFTAADTTLNFFGVALKNVAGIREVLLALWGR